MKRKPKKTKGDISETKFDSIDDFFESNYFTGEERAELEALERKSIVTDTLVQIRKEANMTQAQLAEKMGVTQSAISKIESGSDESLKLAEIKAYSRATDSKIVIQFGTPLTHVEHIKHHVMALKHHLKHLCELSKGDSEIEKGVNTFLSETIYNLLPVFGMAGQAYAAGKGDMEINVSIRKKKKDQLQSNPVAKANAANAGLVTEDCLLG